MAAAAMKEPELSRGVEVRRDRRGEVMKLPETPAERIRILWRLLAMQLFTIALCVTAAILGRSLSPMIALGPCLGGIFLSYFCIVRERRRLR